jgi:hypothetical protein
MVLHIALLLLMALPQDLPYKPDTEFVLRFDLSFRTRPQESTNRVNFEETRGEYARRTDTSPLPYLELHLKVIEASNKEVRMRVLRGGVQLVNRKIELNKEIKLDIGFTADIKDRLVPHEYEVFFLSADKKALSRILIQFTEDGDYLVNGVRRGKI